MEQEMHNYPALSKFYHPPWEKYEERGLYEATLELGDLGARLVEVEYRVTKQEGRPCSVEIDKVILSELESIGWADIKDDLTKVALEFLEKEVLEAEIMYWEGRK